MEQNKNTKVNKGAEIKSDTIDPKKATVIKTAGPEGNAKKEAPKKKGNKKCCCCGISLVIFIIVVNFLPFVGLGFFGLFSGGHSDDPNFEPPKTLIGAIQDKVSDSTSSSKKLSSSKKTDSNSDSSNTPTENSSTDTASQGVEVDQTLTQPEPEPSPENQPPAGSSPVQTYTKQQEIDYFVKIAITDERDNYNEKPLRKWTKQNVYVKYFGTANNTDKACADSTISTINDLSNTLTLIKTKGTTYDIDVNFLTQSELARRGYPYGYMDYRLYDSGAFSHAMAYVPADTLSDSGRCHYIRHEMTHTVGLLYNLGRQQGGYDFSIFNVAVEGFSDYIEIDKDLIKMLYNTGIPVKSTAAQARSFLAGATW